MLHKVIFTRAFVEGQIIVMISAIGGFLLGIAVVMAVDEEKK